MRIAPLLIAAVVSVRAANLPMTLVSEDEAEPIHSAIIRKEGWTQDSVRRLRAEAEKRLKEGPWTVTSDRPKNTEIDVHDYYSEAAFWWPNPEDPGGPYIRNDGQANPNRFMANRQALNAMADAVFTLGAAGFLLDDPRYSQRATRVIHTWFLNPKTRMNPTLDYAQVVPGLNDGRGSGVLDGRAFIRTIQGMEFLAQTGTWDPKERAAVIKWFEEYLHWLTDSKSAIDEKTSGDSHASWWTAQVAAVATFVENQPMQAMAFDFYRTRVFPRQIRKDGSAPGEELRARPMVLSSFNLEAFTIVCRIAQVQGVDLWGVRGRGGATLGTVVDYLEPYLADPHKWTKEQTAEFPNDGLYFLAFAGMGLKKPEYVALFRKLEHSEGAWYSIVDLLAGRWETSAHQTRH